jgi:hypothetical protein
MKKGQMGAGLLKLVLGRAHKAMRWMTGGDNDYDHYSVQSMW